ESLIVTGIWLKGTRSEGHCVTFGPCSWTRRRTAFRTIWLKLPASHVMSVCCLYPQLNSVFVFECGVLSLPLSLCLSLCLSLSLSLCPRGRRWTAWMMCVA